MSQNKIKIKFRSILILIKCSHSYKQLQQDNFIVQATGGISVGQGNLVIMSRNEGKRICSIGRHKRQRIGHILRQRPLIDHSGRLYDWQT